MDNSHEAGLSASAATELQRMTSQLGLPLIIAEQAFTQFQDYLKKTKIFVTQQKLSNILRVAILIVCKTHLALVSDSQQDQQQQQQQQRIKTLRGCTLEVLMQEQTEKIDECIVVLKEWVTFGSIHEPTRMQLKTLVEDFSYMLAIYTKFDKVFRFFSFAEQNLQLKSYNRNLKHLSWLLLLNANEQQQAIIETTLFIIAVFQFMLTSVSRFTTGTFLEENSGNEKQALLKHFHVYDVESYEAIANKFVNSLKQIFEKNIMVHEGDIFQIFSPTSIEENIRNLSIHYKKQRVRDFDEETFITSEGKKKLNSAATTSSAQVNLTPFSRQGGSNKFAAPFPKEKYGLISTQQYSSGKSTNTGSTPFSSQYASQPTPLNKRLAASTQTFASQRFLNYGNSNYNSATPSNIHTINNETESDQQQSSSQSQRRDTSRESKENNRNVLQVQQQQSQLNPQQARNRVVVESTPSSSNHTFASPFQSMKNLQYTPASSSVRGITATPITNAMEMYNWLHSRKNVISCSTGTIALELNRKIENLDVWLQQSIAKVLDLERRETSQFLAKPEYTIEPRIIDSRITQISSLFYRVLNEFYNEERTASENTQKGVLVCACESVYFILNTKTISFEKLVDCVGISWFELWKLMDFFLRLDQTMPVSLKAHILDLEVKVVSYFAWRNIPAASQQSILLLSQDNNSTTSTTSSLLRYVRACASDAEVAKNLLEDRQEGYAIEKFFRRVMHQCAYLTHQLCTAVNLSDTISEGVWRMMKHILANATEMLLQRHLDQLVLCAIYVMCKIFKSDTQFRTILNKYEELNSHNKAMMRELIYDMPITQDRRDNIVEYYNSCFLIAVKKAALQIGKQLSSTSSPTQQATQSTQGNGSALTKNPALTTTPMFTSPLKAMFSSDVGKSMTKLPSHMTPQTQMLYAYTESPFLKDPASQIPSNGSNSNGNAFRSKKMINFDAASDHKPIVMSTTSSTTTINASSQNQFKDKIPFAKYIKPKMDSIIESHQESSASHSIPNKFVKRVNDGVNRSEPVESLIPTTDSSLLNETVNQSSYASNTTPRRANGIENQSQQQQNSITHIAAGGSATALFKGFVTQKQPFVNQNLNNTSSSASMQSPIKSQRSLLMLTPKGAQKSPNVLPSQPLTQIPMQKINSWQNQHNSFTAKLQEAQNQNQQQQKQLPVQAITNNNGSNSILEQLRKKI